MILICDDRAQSFFWADDKDETEIISPRFDHVEDAINWRRNKEEKVYEILEKTWAKTTE